MKIKLNKQPIEIQVKKVTELGKFSGLMFRTSKTKILLFEFRKNKVQYIHSFFVFFPFLAVWLNGENTVVGCQIVKPFVPNISSRKSAKKLVEIPFNSRNKQIINLLVGKWKDLNIWQDNHDHKNKKGG
jgi:uncharacterized membrane protein (UPF0127 family)